MLIQHQQNDHQGMFYVGDENEPLAEMVYSLPSGDKMVIEHTEVKDEFLKLEVPKVV